MPQTLQQFSKETRELYVIWAVSEVCKDQEYLERARHKEKILKIRSNLFDKLAIPAYISGIVTPSLVIASAMGILPIYVPVASGALFAAEMYLSKKEGETDKALEKDYRMAYPKTIRIHPPEVHQVFALLERDLRNFGIDSGYKFRLNVWGAFSDELEEFLEEESSFGLGTINFYSNKKSAVADYSIGPNVGEFFFGKSHFTWRIRKFEEDFSKVLGRGDLEIFSKKAVEYSNLERSQLYKNAAEISKQL